MSELNYFLNREKIPTKEELNEAFASDGSERTYEGKFSPAKEEQKEKEIETSWGRNYEEVVNLIRDYQEEGISDEEREIIEKRKELTLKQLDRVLIDIDRYISQIDVQANTKPSYDSENISSDQDEVEISNEERRRCHNRLIDDLKIATRLINTCFNVDYPDAERVKIEKDFFDRKGKSDKEILEIRKQKKLIKFAMPGALISEIPKDPYAARNFIASWAAEIYKDFSVLEPEIVDSLEKIKRD